MRSYVYSPGCLINWLAGCEIVFWSVVVRASPVLILRGIILTHWFCPGRITVRRNYTHTRKTPYFSMEAVALIAPVRPIVEFVFQE